MREKLSYLIWNVPTRLCFAIFLFGGAARADVVFSNVGAAPGYDPSVGFAIFAHDNGVRQAVGAQFRVGPTRYLFSAASLAVRNTGGPSADLNVMLMSDDGANHPGNLLETITLHNLSGAIGAVAPADPNSPLYLSSGAAYWLCAAVPPGQFGDEAWQRTSATSSTGFYCVSLGNESTPWSSYPGSQLEAFTIFGSPVAVPEPSCFLMLLIGIVFSVTVSRCFGNARSKGLWAKQGNEL